MMPSPLLGVLRLLSHERFQSGQWIAQRLGCSRATVHNAILRASEAGVPVHAVHGRGYRLAAPLSWLDGDGLAGKLAPIGISLRCHDEIDSTNADLMSWTQAGAPHRAAVTAESQTRGRGRRGREWRAGLGAGLMFSLLWRSGRPAAELSGLSLAVGAILADAIRSLGVSGARVKWPNDILVDDAKLAGVLIELNGDMLGPSAAIIGVGINVTGGQELSASIGQPVTDLHRHIGYVDRNDLLVTLLSRLSQDLALFEARGFPAFRESWQACHVHQDREVTIDSAGGGRIVGRARGVDEQGALLLETDSGLRRILSGEVSLRAVVS